MKSEIHIYDLEGNSIEKLELDNLINLFSIDEERRLILGHAVRLAQTLVLFKF